MSEVPDLEERRREDWHHIGAAFILAAIAIIVLVVAFVLQSGRQSSRIHDLKGTVGANRARIDQLEAELRAHDLPVPAPPTTTTTTTVTTTRRSTFSRPPSTSTTTTTAPPTTTTTVPPGCSPLPAVLCGVTR